MHRSARNILYGGDLVGVDLQPIKTRAAPLGRHAVIASEYCGIVVCGGPPNRYCKGFTEEFLILTNERLQESFVFADAKRHLSCVECNLAVVFVNGGQWFGMGPCWACQGKCLQRELGESDFMVSVRP